MTAANKDRILVGVCAAIWLLLLGVGVAAVVALTELGRGFQQGGGGPHTGLLYTIIGVSALVIAAAIPVLLRARRAAPVDVELRRAAPRKPVHTEQSPMDDDGVAENRHAAVLHAALDQLWVRGAAGLAGTLGAAFVGAAAGTYLLAVGKDTAAWTGFGVGGAIALGMPVLL